MENRLPAIHPGEFLQEILDDLQLSQAQLAKALDISPMRISYILKGSRPITAELALRFARAFNQSPQYWINLQTNYDLKTAQTKWQDTLIKVKPLIANYSATN
jgi:addiction module HigA family antidote